MRSSLTSAPGASGGGLATGVDGTAASAAAAAPSYYEHIQGALARASSALPFFGPAAPQDPLAHLRARPRVIVSLTTIPDRIFLLRKTIESLLEQTAPADEILLNIPYKVRKAH